MDPIFGVHMNERKLLNNILNIVKFLKADN